MSLAFGLTVLTMAYAVGHISGGHFNPAVTLGLWAAGGRFHAARLRAVRRRAGARRRSRRGRALRDRQRASRLRRRASGFAANGYGDHSPGGYSLTAALVAEVVMTSFFLIVILGATDRRAPAGFAPIAIGLALTLIHLISIPVTNTSVNPARRTAPALFVGGWALASSGCSGWRRWSVAPSRAWATSS